MGHAIINVSLMSIRLRKPFFLILVLLFSLGVRLINLNQMGRTADEDYIVQKGWKFVSMAEAKDFSNSYWYSVPDHPPVANYLYGLASELDVRGYNSSQISSDNTYKGVPVFSYDLTYGRLLSVLLSSLTILLVTLFGWEYISPFVGVTAGLIMSAIPFYLGLSQIVFLEIPLALFFTGAVYAFFAAASRKSTLYAILAGILTGIALEVKQTAFLLFPLFLALYLQWRFFRSKSKYRLSRAQLWYFLIATVLSYIIVWPMPLFHLSYYISFTYNTWLQGNGYPEWFFGGLHIDPIYYYTVYFLIIIPLLLLLFFFFGVYKALSSKQVTLLSVVLWIAVPFIGQSLFSLRQHELRYVVEIFAPLSLLVAYGLEEAAAVLPFKQAKYFLLILTMIYMLFILWQQTPYYLDYFNELVGGTKNVYDKKWFQFGWGGPGEKAGGIYIIQHAHKGQRVGEALDPSKNLPTVSWLKYSQYNESKHYDWVVVNYYDVIRDGFNESQVREKYQLVYTVYDNGAPLVHVYRQK